MEEPSVLDYLKSILMPWKYPRIEIPPEPGAQREPGPVLQTETAAAACCGGCTRDYHSRGDSIGEGAHLSVSLAQLAVIVAGHARTGDVGAAG